MRVLAYPKFKLEKAGQALLLADFLPYAETIPLQDSPLNLPALREPADQMFLTLAITDKADALVTGDTDFLEIKSSFKTSPILTPGEFEHWLRR